jgi:hypothetical protein
MIPHLVPAHRIEPTAIRVDRHPLILRASSWRLERAVREYIEAHNVDCKPFVWTKSADDILASIARFAARTLTTQA